MALAPLVAIAAALLGAVGAAPTTKSSACSFLAPGAAPLLEVKGKNGKAPLALYPIGFSREGRLAWLEQRRGFDDEAITWLLRVVDLSTDRRVLEQEFSVRVPGPDPLCKKYGPSIARSLRKHKIEGGAAMTLEQPGDGREPEAAQVLAGKRNRETFKTPFQVILRARDGGSKVLGVLWRVEVDSGEPPLDPPKIAGLLRSPWEPRVAVVATQRMIGTEGVDLTMVSMLGGRLDRGWGTSR